MTISAARPLLYFNNLIYLNIRIKTHRSTQIPWVRPLKEQYIIIAFNHERINGKVESFSYSMKSLLHYW
jgi:hypothetical protein